MTPRLVLATRNEHKVRELRAIMAPFLPGIAPEVIVGASAYDLPEPVEDAVTFAGNALIKARQLASATRLPAVADDSGLCVDVLGGSPGIFSARWCGHHGDDAANLSLLLHQLSDVPAVHRGARFHCAAVLVTPDGREITCEADMHGVLLFEARGEGGFGYDPIFVPDEYATAAVSAAELTAEQKDAISHRGRAFRALAPSIQAELGIEEI